MGTQNSQNNHGKGQSGKIRISRFQNLLQGYSNQDSTDNGTSTRIDIQINGIEMRMQK